MSVLSILLTAGTIASYVITAAGDGDSVQKELVQMAAMLPWEEVSHMYLDRGKVEDYNGDGIPEVYLTAGNGWEYAVYYYLDGGLHTVEGLQPWAWSSDLCVTKDGHLVLYTCPHTTGTAGNYNHRIYEWTEEGYCLEEDLWSKPDEYDQDGTVLKCRYYFSETATDPFLGSDADAEEIPITKEEYEKRIKDLGEMTSVFEEGLEWGFNFWQEHDYEDVSVLVGVYRQIQEEILNWEIK